jgi:hypothetical protein
MWYFSNRNNISFHFLANYGHLDPYAHLDFMYVEECLEVRIRYLTLSLSSKFKKDFCGISPSLSFSTWIFKQVTPSLLSWYIP